MKREDCLTDEQRGMFDFLNKMCPHSPCFVAVHFGACVIYTSRNARPVTPSMMHSKKSTKKYGCTS